MTSEIDMSGIELTDGTVILKPYGANDVDDVFAAGFESRDTVGQWMAWCHPNYARGDAERWVTFARQRWGREYNFAIRDAGNLALLGGCGLNRIDREHGFANLGYWVRTSATRRGVASSAARLLAEWGIRHLGLHRLEIVAAVGNAASQRAAEKSGARREAVLRSRLSVHGRPHDAVMFSIIEADLG